MNLSEFLIPDEMAMQAVESACGFFGLPEVPVVNSDGVCVWQNDTATPFDDVFGFDRDQMADMGIISTDALTLVYSHECAHRALQGYDGIDGKNEELACDYFAGIQAGLHDMDTGRFEEALAQTAESDTHPDGELRVEAIEYGRQVAADMVAQGIPVTFDSCMDRFDDFLAGHQSADVPSVCGGDISFGSAYTKEEYVVKAENCYKEADKYTEKANRAEKPFDIEHNLAEAKKWRSRGDEYMQKSKYA